MWIARPSCLATAGCVVLSSVVCTSTSGVDAAPSRGTTSPKSSTSTISTNDEQDSLADAHPGARVAKQEHEDHAEHEPKAGLVTAVDDGSGPASKVNRSRTNRQQGFLSGGSLSSSSSSGGSVFVNASPTAAAAERSDSPPDGGDSCDPETALINHDPQAQHSEDKQDRLAAGRINVPGGDQDEVLSSASDPSATSDDDQKTPGPGTTLAHAHRFRYENCTNAASGDDINENVVYDPRSLGWDRRTYGDALRQLPPWVKKLVVGVPLLCATGMVLVGATTGQFLPAKEKTLQEVVVEGAADTATVGVVLTPTTSTVAHAQAAAVAAQHVLDHDSALRLRGGKSAVTLTSTTSGFQEQATRSLPPYVPASSTGNDSWFWTGVPLVSRESKQQLQAEEREETEDALRPKLDSATGGVASSTLLTSTSVSEREVDASSVEDEDVSSHELPARTTTSKEQSSRGINAAAREFVEEENAEHGNLQAPMEATEAATEAAATEAATEAAAASAAKAAVDVAVAKAEVEAARLQQQPRPGARISTQAAPIAAAAQVQDGAGRDEEVDREHLREVAHALKRYGDTRQRVGAISKSTKPMDLEDEKEHRLHTTYYDDNGEKAHGGGGKLLPPPWINDHRGNYNLPSPPAPPSRKAPPPPPSRPPPPEMGMPITTAAKSVDDMRVELKMPPSTTSTSTNSGVRVYNDDVDGAPVTSTTTSQTDYNLVVDDDFVLWDINALNSANVVHALKMATRYPIAFVSAFFRAIFPEQTVVDFLFAARASVVKEDRVEIVGKKTVFLNAVGQDVSKLSQADRLNELHAWNFGNVLLPLWREMVAPTDLMEEIEELKLKHKEDAAALKRGRQGAERGADTKSESILSYNEYGFARCTDVALDLLLDAASHVSPGGDTHDKDNHHEHDDASSGSDGVSFLYSSPQQLQRDAMELDEEADAGAAGGDHIRIMSMDLSSLGDRKSKNVKAALTARQLILQSVYPKFIARLARRFVFDATAVSGGLAVWLLSRGGAPSRRSSFLTDDRVLEKIASGRHHRHVLDPPETEPAAGGGNANASVPRHAGFTHEDVVEPPTRPPTTSASLRPLRDDRSRAREEEDSAFVMNKTKELVLPRDADAENYDVTLKRTWGVVMPPPVVRRRLLLRSTVSSHAVLGDTDNLTGNRCLFNRLFFSQASRYREGSGAALPPLDAFLISVVVHGEVPFEHTFVLGRGVMPEVVAEDDSGAGGRAPRRPGGPEKLRVKRTETDFASSFFVFDASDAFTLNDQVYQHQRRSAAFLSETSEGLPPSVRTLTEKDVEWLLCTSWLKFAEKTDFERAGGDEIVIPEASAESWERVKGEDGGELDPTEQLSHHVLWKNAWNEKIFRNVFPNEILAQKGLALPKIKSIYRINTEL